VTHYSTPAPSAKPGNIDTTRINGRIRALSSGALCVLAALSVPALAVAAAKTHSIPEAGRIAYTKAYARPGRMAAGFAYFAVFPQTAMDFAELAKTKLPFPVLSIGGDKANGDALGAQMKLIAPDLTVIVLKDTGHWILEERRKETIEALARFLR
jgi:pimeloyl-ACP methyl ester carboxylesterase